MIVLIAHSGEPNRTGSCSNDMGGTYLDSTLKESIEELAVVGGRALGRREDLAEKLDRLESLF